MKHLRLNIALGLTAVLVTLAACSDNSSDPVLVFAAASLSDPVTELVRQFEEETGTPVDISFGGSNALARQITAGAPADLFISAGPAPIDLLIQESVAVADDAVVLFSNQLVIVAGQELTGVDSLESLASDRVARIAIVDPELGPAGLYAQQALRSAGLWNTLLDKIVLTQDVRLVMTHVGAGTVDAGIVYRTDALTEPSLELAYTVPAEFHARIQYVGVVIHDSDRRLPASRLLEFVASPEGSETFRRYGFITAP